MPEYRNHKQLCGGEIHAAEFSLKYLVIIINIDRGVNKLLTWRGLCAPFELMKMQGPVQFFFRFVLLALLVLSDKG